MPRHRSAWALATCWSDRRRRGLFRSPSGRRHRALRSTLHEMSMSVADVWTRRNEPSINRSSERAFAKAPPPPAAPPAPRRQSACARDAVHALPPPPAGALTSAGRRPFEAANNASSDCYDGVRPPRRERPILRRRRPRSWSHWAMTSDADDEVRQVCGAGSRMPRFLRGSRSRDGPRPHRMLARRR